MDFGSLCLAMLSDFAMESKIVSAITLDLISDITATMQI